VEENRSQKVKRVLFGDVVPQHVVDQRVIVAAAVRMDLAVKLGQHRVIEADGDRRRPW
jgi:hypothetical protein